MGGTWGLNIECVVQASGQVATQMPPCKGVLGVFSWEETHLLGLVALTTHNKI